MRELKEYLDVSQSIVSRSIVNLTEKGLIKRGTASDRRKSELMITPEARKILRRCSGQLHELSFILRHQPDFRISVLIEQLDKIQLAVETAKTRPILRTKKRDQEKGESVMVRIAKSVGVK